MLGNICSIERSIPAAQHAALPEGDGLNERIEEQLVLQDFPEVASSPSLDILAKSKQRR